MDQIEIGLWVTAGLLVMVIMGMRVAFAAALAGVVGLVLIFWAKKDFDPEKFGWALTVAVKQAGQVPHSKVASHELSLIPTFILIGYLAYYAGLTRSLLKRLNVGLLGFQEGWLYLLFSPPLDLQLSQELQLLQLQYLPE